MEINLIYKNVNVGKVNLEVIAKNESFKYICNGCFKEYENFPNRCDVCGYSECQKETV